MRKLRTQLVLSHLISILLITPLIGFGLIYLLQTRVVMPGVLEDLSTQGKMIAQMTRDRPEVWARREAAQALLWNTQFPPTERVTLLDANGRVLASNDVDNQRLAGQLLDDPGLADALQGRMSTRANLPPRGLDSELASALIPVTATNGRVIGVVRLTRQEAAFVTELMQLRFVIALGMLVALLLQVPIGWALASSLQRPLTRLTDAVEQLERSVDPLPIAEAGPAEIRSLSRGFNRLVARLNALEQNRRQLRATLVHELGRPMAAMRSSIQALRLGADGDLRLRQELLAGMDREAGRLQHVLSDLAQMHNLLLDPLRLNAVPTDWNEWLPLVLAPWRQVAQFKGLEWSEELAPDLPVLNVDADRLAQALENLLSNACKFTPAGGRVTVMAGCENGSAWIRVSDTGPGIPEQEHERIFEPFYRSRSDGAAEGMGLGLHIARELVDAHSGYLAVESQPGAGSHFTIRIPRVV